jgi:RNA polymerase sigma-70 factor (ECF subfamily)
MTAVDKYHLKPLLRRALSGDAAAWNDFFQQIRKYVHAKVREMVGPNAPGPLELSVIVQSTLRRVWENIEEQFPDGAEDAGLGRFLAWVKTIARNRCMDEWRRPDWRRIRPVGSVIDGFAEPQPWDRGIKRGRLAAELAAALARLPERRRQVVELFWFEGLSDAEISERLGCKAGTVRVIRFRALRELQSPKLQSLLEESHDG